MSARLFTRAFLTVLVFLFSNSIFSAPIDISKSRRGELLKISEELTPAFLLVQKVLNSGRQTESYEEDMGAIETLSKYYVLEGAGTIWMRLKVEVLRILPSKQNDDFRQLAENALLEMMTESDTLILNDVETTISFVKNKHYTSPDDRLIAQNIIKELTQLIVRIKEKTKAPPLPTLEDLLGGSRMTREQTQRNLEQFSKILNKRIIGQPEVVEALEALEWEYQFLAQEENRAPDVIYFIGSPGTGKDTAAEAFTDALHGEEGAHKTHMFRFPLMKARPDLWQVLGSATGYIGSEQFPPFLKFLVEHSGGKYVLEEEGKSVKIIANPNWRGTSLPGFAPPESAVVFMNEFHNWSKEIKDVLVKQALEKGIFMINNPNGGLAEISVPVRFVIASNEGLSLVTSREANGQRYGKPLSYDEMFNKWSKSQGDKKRLKTEILNGNGAARDPMRNQDTGISEELLNRIPDRFLLLMRPLSPDGLKDVAQMELDRIAKSFEKESPLNPGITITWDPSILEFVQSYDYQPEDNARPIRSKIKSLIKEPLIRFFKSHQFESPDEGVFLGIKLIKNSDGTSSLEIEHVLENGKSEIYLEEIPSTVKDRKAEPLSDEQIERLSQLSEKIKTRVFGVDLIADRISDRVLSLANQTAASDKTPRSASTLVLMGLSSTGKTELSKAITEALTGDEKNALVIDFSQVQSIHDFKSRVLGLRDAYGNPIPSDFMMHYDRSDGDVVVVFDELANVKDPDILKSLYDFFREPIVSTFSDGKERVMSRVKVIVTGNSGIELYESVPRDVPMEQQMLAWETISESLIKDPEAQRVVLEKKFPEPLLNRWGKNNIFFVPPHTYKTLKQLTILKLEKMVESLRPEDGRRGWNLGFSSQKDLEAFIHKVIEKGFTLREQGASIDSFVKDDILAPLEAALLKSHVPSGSRILIRKEGETFRAYSGSTDFNTEITLKKKTGKEDKEEEEDFTKNTEVAQIFTAYHEVGHALTTKLLMKDQQDPTLISIIPGVTKINNQWISYAGIAESMIRHYPRVTREWVVRQIAILAAGETAERLISRGEVHSAGKSNDMERATSLAERAILIFGLSESWGTEAVPTKTDMNVFISRFSEEKKRLFEMEVKKLLDEGRSLARHILITNFDEVVVPMSKALAEKGIMKEEEMSVFFANAQLSFDEPSWVFKTANVFRRAYSRWINREIKRDGVFKSPDLAPSKVANIEEIVNSRKLELFNQVALPDSLPIFEEQGFRVKDLPTAKCGSMLTGATTP